MKVADDKTFLCKNAYRFEKNTDFACTKANPLLETLEHYSFQ